MVLVTRVPCNKEHNGNGGKNNGNKGGEQAMVTRAMTTATATTWAMVTVTRLVDERWQKQQRGQWQR
jgi:hypothetical protein